MGVHPSFGKRFKHRLGQLVCSCRNHEANVARGLLENDLGDHWGKYRHDGGICLTQRKEVRLRNRDGRTSV